MARRRSRRKSRATGKLEKKVDAVLRTQGLSLNEDVEVLAERARRRTTRFRPFKKGRRGGARKKTSRRKPARGKRLSRRR